MNTYVIKKEVEAVSLTDAIKKESKAEITDVYLQGSEPRKSMIGFHD